MHERELTRVSDQIKATLGHATLRQLGQDSGFIIRERTITADLFVPSLIKSLASHKVESIADIVRDFNFDHGLTVHYKPFYEKLDTPCFPRLMRNMFESMLTEMYVPVLAPLRDGPFARFEDIIIQDGSSFALHDDLAEVFAGRFTTISPAAVELHCTMSLFTDNLVTVFMTGDAECERHYLPEPKDLKGKLLLADRGYDSTKYMLCVDKEGGSFLVRIRKNLNPRVVKIHRRGKRYRDLEGKCLRTVVRRLRKDAPYDMDICWEDNHGQPTRCFRLVMSWNSAKKQWARVMTNLNRAEFSIQDILQAYRLRWQIELLFKEIKSYANLHRFSTVKETIAEGLIWASLCAAFLKRYLGHACQRVLGQAISTRRVAMCGHHIVARLCASLKRMFRDLADRLEELFEFLCHNAKRSNPGRERTTGRLALGLRLAGVRS